ncbi:hypothetical protein JOC24_006312 [Streptomyces sp. HB132]|nr:hypothetical protein [Streptomyces sp. HB132]
MGEQLRGKSDGLPERPWGAWAQGRALLLPQHDRPPRPVRRPGFCQGRPWRSSSAQAPSAPCSRRCRRRPLHHRPRRTHRRRRSDLPVAPPAHRPRNVPRPAAGSAPLSLPASAACRANSYGIALPDSASVPSQGSVSTCAEARSSMALNTVATFVSLTQSSMSTVATAGPPTADSPRGAVVEREAEALSAPNPFDPLLPSRAETGASIRHCPEAGTLSRGVGRRACEGNRGGASAPRISEPVRRRCPITSERLLCDPFALRRAESDHRRYPR